VTVRVETMGDAMHWVASTESSLRVGLVLVAASVLVSCVTVNPCGSEAPGPGACATTPLLPAPQGPAPRAGVEVREAECPGEVVVRGYRREFPPSVMLLTDCVSRVVRSLEREQTAPLAPSAAGTDVSDVAIVEDDLGVFLSFRERVPLSTLNAVVEGRPPVTSEVQESQRHMFVPCLVRARVKTRWYPALLEIACAGNDRGLTPAAIRVRERVLAECVEGN